MINHQNAMKAQREQYRREDEYRKAQWAARVQEARDNGTAERCYYCDSWTLPKHESAPRTVCPDCGPLVSAMRRKAEEINGVTNIVTCLWSAFCNELDGNPEGVTEGIDKALEVADSLSFSPVPNYQPRNSQLENLMQQGEAGRHQDVLNGPQVRKLARHLQYERLIRPNWRIQVGGFALEGDEHNARKGDGLIYNWRDEIGSHFVRIASTHRKANLVQYECLPFSPDRAQVFAENTRAWREFVSTTNQEEAETIQTEQRERIERAAYHDHFVYQVNHETPEHFAHLVDLPLTEKQRAWIAYMEIRPGVFGYGKLVRIVRIKSGEYAGEIHVHQNAGNAVEHHRILETEVTRVPWHERPKGHQWERLHEYDKPKPKTPEIDLEAVKAQQADAEKVEAYQERKEARIERYKTYAQNAKARSEAGWATARRMASVIPMGQPILIGHHSEQRDRNYRERIHKTEGRAVKEWRKGEYWERRTEAAGKNHAIMSDDPEAAQKLAAKIERLEARQERMKTANKIMRGKGTEEEKRAKLIAAGLSERDADRLTTPRRDYNGDIRKDKRGNVVYASYGLTNNSANIRRLKQRLAEVLATQDREEVGITVGSVRIEESDEYQSTEIYFPGKPSEAIRAALKAYPHRFRWGRQSQAWYKKDRSEETLEFAINIADWYAHENN